MQETFSVSPLCGDPILQAYALIREAAGAISIEEWRAYIKLMLAAKSTGGDAHDVVGICSSNNYLRGLFTYHVVPDVRHQRTLVVEYFVVESVFSPREIATALMDGVDAVARAEGCNAIHANLPSAANWLVKMLHERGYGSGTWQLCKHLTDDSTTRTAG